MQKGENCDKINYNFKKHILIFLKGFLVGCSFIIPGLCSAMMSMILNVYQDLLLIIEQFYDIKIIKKNIFFILGIILGIVLIILGLSFLFKDYSEILEIFFLGLAIGGFFDLFKNNKPHKIVDFLIILLGIFFSLLPEILILKTTNFDNLVIIIFGGFLSSLAFIMPGISGSLILLTLGIYPIIINSLSNVFQIFITTPDSMSIKVSIAFLISFSIGAVLFSKIIKRILVKYEEVFLKFCLGLLLGSICIILITVMKIDLNIIFKLVLCISGFVVIKLLN